MQFGQLKRREFITMVGSAAAAWPLAARAQRAAMPVVGYLSSLTQANSDRCRIPPRSFRNGLCRTPERIDRIPLDHRSLWSATGDGDGSRAAPGSDDRRIRATGSACSQGRNRHDPHRLRHRRRPAQIWLCRKLQPAGGNVTGIWMVSTVLAQKRLQLVRELLPKAELITLLVNPTSPVAEPQTQDAQAAARVLGLKLIVLGAVTENDFDQIFATMVQQRAAALFVSADPFLSSRREQLVALAARHAIPTLYEIREFVEAGGLMSYGTDLREAYYKGGLYAGRVLKGVNPADLPVEQINKLELVINLKTARVLGLEVPPTLLATADEVIE